MTETEDAVDGGGRSEIREKSTSCAFFRGDESEHALSIDDALSLLANARRRHLLVFLVEQAPQDVTLESAVEALARVETDSSGDEPSDSIHIQLVHSHLPRLENTGVVSYHRDCQMITYHRDPTLERLLRTVRELDSST